MKKFCESLRKHVTKMIYFEKKKKKSLNSRKFAKKQKFVIIYVKKKLTIKMLQIKKVM